MPSITSTEKNILPPNNSCIMNVLKTIRSEFLLFYRIFGTHTGIPAWRMSKRFVQKHVVWFGLGSLYCGRIAASCTVGTSLDLSSNIVKESQDSINSANHCYALTLQSRAFLLLETEKKPLNHTTQENYRYALSTPPMPFEPMFRCNGCHWIYKCEWLRISQKTLWTPPLSTNPKNSCISMLDRTGSMCLDPKKHPLELCLSVIDYLSIQDEDDCRGTAAFLDRSTAFLSFFSFMISNIWCETRQCRLSQTSKVRNSACMA